MSLFELLRRIGMAEDVARDMVDFVVDKTIWLIGSLAHLEALRLNGMEVNRKEYSKVKESLEVACKYVDDERIKPFVERLRWAVWDGNPEELLDLASTAMRRAAGRRVEAWARIFG